MPQISTILGGPGSGKTYNLIKTIADKIKEGYPADEMVFITFSNKMAKRGIERIEGFVGRETNLWYAGTCHGLGYKIASMLGFKKADYDFFSSFFRSIGVPFSPFVNDINIDKIPVGNKYMYVREMFIKDNMILVRDVSESRFASWYADRKFPLLLRYTNTTKMYWAITNLEDKMYDNNLIDFVDMLLMTVKHADMINAQFIFHDEANDMDNLMYQSILRFRNDVYIAGDPAQVCYDLFGASPRYMDDLAKRGEIIELKKSFRVPEVIGKYAEKFLNWVPYLVPRPEWMNKEGKIGRINLLSTNNLTWFVSKTNQKPTRILFFTNYNLNKFADSLFMNGIPYFVDSTMAKKPPWSKEDLINLILIRNLIWKIKKGIESSINAREISAFNRFSTVQLTPLMIPVFKKGNYLRFLRIKPEWAKWIEYSMRWNFEFNTYPELSTIHAFKGGEEDVVMLDTRLPWYFWRERDLGFVKEYFARLMYIALTRAKEEFYFFSVDGTNNVFDFMRRFM